TSANASTAAPNLASAEAAPSTNAATDRARASSSIEPPTVSSSSVPPSVQNTLGNAERTAIAAAAYASWRGRMPSSAGRGGTVGRIGRDELDAPVEAVDGECDKQ